MTRQAERHCSDRSRLLASWSCCASSRCPAARPDIVRPGAEAGTRPAPTADRGRAERRRHPSASAPSSPPRAPPRSSVPAQVAGVEVAVKEINLAGGVLGKPVRGAAPGLRRRLDHDGGDLVRRPGRQEDGCHHRAVVVRSRPAPACPSSSRRRSPMIATAATAPGHHERPATPATCSARSRPMRSREPRSRQLLGKTKGVKAALVYFDDDQGNAVHGTFATSPEEGGRFGRRLAEVHRCEHDRHRARRGDQGETGCRGRGQPVHRDGAEQGLDHRALPPPASAARSCGSPAGRWPTTRRRCPMAR